MEIGISLYFVRKENLIPFMKMGAQKGISSFELAYEIPYLEEMKKITREIDALRKEGISFSLHAPWIECNMGSLYKEIRLFSRERLIETIDMATNLGLNPVIIHPAITFFEDKELKALAQKYFLEELEIIFEKGIKNGVQLCLENLPFESSFFFKTKDLSILKSRLPIKICYDTGHALMATYRDKLKKSEDFIVQEILDNKDEIVQIHLHNNYGKKDEHLFYSGLLDMKKILAILRKCSYMGRIMVESEDIEDFGLDHFLNWLNSLAE